MVSGVEKVRFALLPSRPDAQLDCIFSTSSRHIAPPVLQLHHHSLTVRLRAQDAMNGGGEDVQTEIDATRKQPSNACTSISPAV